MNPASVRAERLFNRFSDGVGSFSAILLLLLVANVFYDVIMRYLFNNVSIGMQELEWHLFSMIFLFGIAYTLKADGHVRVDIIYERLSVKRRAIIDILGTLLFIWPFCFLVAFYGIDFGHNAFVINEQSGDPGGLPYRWVIKSMISLAFICVLISSIGFMLRAWNEYRGLTPAHEYDSFKP
jgi:TRAP-type mannitol/chloroaromatic compound transport system permease small subunit